MGLSTPSTGGGAPKGAEYVTGSSNSKLSNETVVSPAGDILVSGDIDGTTALSPGLDSFTQVSSAHPALLTAIVAVQSDGSVPGQVQIEVDESGGTSPDYSVIFAEADPQTSDSFFGTGAVTVLLPAGAQFQLANELNPAGGNHGGSYIDS